MNDFYLIDVGASGGAHSRWEPFAPFLHEVLFDPDPRAALDRPPPRAQKQQTVIQSALWEEEQTMRLHLTKKPQVSSLYEPNIDFLAHYTNPERFDTQKTKDLQTTTLDQSLRKHGIDEAHFIKLDTQGSELNILKGGLFSLEKCVGIEVEVEFAELYKRQPLFHEVDHFIQNQGFELYDISRTYWRLRGSTIKGYEKGRLIFGDALYFRSPHEVIKKEDQRMVRNLVVSYLAYGYEDHAQYLSQMTGKAEDIIAAHKKNFKKRKRIYRAFLRGAQKSRIIARLIRGAEKLGH